MKTIEAIPYIRSLVAFIIYLRYGGTTLEVYERADRFVGEFKKDLEQNQTKEN